MSELYTNSVYFSDFNNRKKIFLTRSAYYLSHKLLKLVSVLQLECKGNNWGIYIYLFACDIDSLNCIK